MIIHSPIVSGSLTFANGATFTLPTGGVYSGSFSGSYQGTTFAGGTFSGNGSALTFGGTGIISGSSQLITEFDARYLNTGGDGIVSSSAQVITLLPTGTISGSSQVDGTAITNKSITIAGTSTSLGGSITAATILQGTGVVSGSSQITAGSTTNFATDVKTQLNSNTVVSGSSQIDAAATTNFASGVKTQLNSNTVVSGSSQIDGASLGSNKTITIGSTSITLGGTSTTIAGLSSVSSTAFTGALTGNASTATTLQTARTINGTSFDGSANITIPNLVSGSSQIDLTATTNYATGIKTQLDSNTVVSGSAQIVGILSPLNTFSASQEAKDNTIGAYTASLETKNTALGTYTGSNDTKWSNLGSQSGSFARTNSANIFSGNQTITGSLFISQDLVVAGSSSIQNISSSALVIGAAYVTLNTFSPSSRFAGLRIIDSGSAGSSGSFLYDSVDDEFVFVHKGNGINVTSSHVVMGPETYDNLGNEIYMTTNRIPKVLNYEHIGDSNISDTGTLITLGSNTIVTGTLLSTGTSLVSGSSQIAFSGVTGTVSNAQLANSAITIAGTSTSLGGSIPLSTITGASGIISGSSQIAGLTNSNLSGTAGISNANLANSAITIAGTSTSLGGSIALSTITGASGIISGSSQITGLTTSNLSGTAGITNGQLANSSVTVTAGTGLSGGGAVSLGGSVTLSNAGVTSNVAGTGVSVSGATGAVTISIGQAVATTSNVQFNSLGIGMAASATAGRIDATNDIVAYSSSDIRFKENITPIEKAIDKINQIGGYTYDWKEENKIEHGYEGNDVGVIAQEIEAVLPQLVQTRESGYKAVKYDKLVALLIEGIKEQQFQIDELRNKIEKLENGK